MAKVIKNIKMNSIEKQASSYVAEIRYQNQFTENLSFWSNEIYKGVLHGAKLASQWNSPDEKPEEDNKFRGAAQM